MYTFTTISAVSYVFGYVDETYCSYRQSCMCLNASDLQTSAESNDRHHLREVCNLSQGKCN